MGFLGFQPVLNPTIERSLRRLWRWLGTGFGSFIDQAKRAVASKRYYGLPVRSLADGLEFGGTKNDPTEGEAPKVVLGTGFSYWGNRPTKTPIPLLTPAGASTVAIIT